MGFKHEDVPFRGACENCRMHRKRCNGQPDQTCEACRTYGLTCIKELRKKTGRPCKTSNSNQTQQQQQQQQQWHPSQLPTPDSQSAASGTASNASTLIPSSPFSNPKEQIGLSEDRLQELQDAFTVRSSWPEDTEMLDLLAEEGERDQEQQLIDLWQKRPP